MIRWMNAGMVIVCLLLVLPGGVFGAESDRNTTITLERGMCYGSCPVYTLTLSEDGTVVYDGQMYVKEIGVRNGSINATSFTSLMEQFGSAGFFGLNDTYTGYDMTDMPSATITITNGTRTKTVEHYFGDRHAPDILYVLEDAVDQSVNVTEWTIPYEPEMASQEQI